MRRWGMPMAFASPFASSTSDAGIEGERSAHALPQPLRLLDLGRGYRRRDAGHGQRPLAEGVKGRRGHVGAVDAAGEGDDGGPHLAQASEQAVALGYE